MHGFMNLYMHGDYCDTSSIVWFAEHVHVYHMCKDTSIMSSTLERVVLKSIILAISRVDNIHEIICTRILYIIIYDITITY